MSYQLAQMNIGRLLAPIDDPKIEGFVAQLDTINALAESQAGFVWRLKDDSNDATDLSPYNDPHLIVNLSVWESIDTLHAFTYQSGHLEVFRQRRSWFERMQTPHLVLWWIPAGHQPDTVEGKERLDLLAQKGPSPRAFTFAKTFAPPAAEI